MGGSPAATNWRGGGVGRAPQNAKTASPAQTSDRAAQARAGRLRRQYHASKAPTMHTGTRISNSRPRANSSILWSSPADGSIQDVSMRSLATRTTRSPILNVSIWHAPGATSLGTPWAALDADESEARARARHITVGAGLPRRDR